MYNYKNKEANFGKPLSNEVNGGTHIALEIIIKKGDKYFVLRRPRGIPGHPQSKEERNGRNLYFCHDLIRHGETVEKAVKRIVLKQAGVRVKSLRTVFLDSITHENNNWAVIPYIIAEVDKEPKKNKEVSEVITFNKTNIPEGFAWWTKKEVKEFIKKYDN